MKLYFSIFWRVCVHNAVCFPGNTHSVLIRVMLLTNDVFFLWEFVLLNHVNTTLAGNIGCTSRFVDQRSSVKLELLSLDLYLRTSNVWFTGMWKINWLCDWYQYEIWIELVLCLTYNFNNCELKIDISSTLHLNRATWTIRLENHIEKIGPCKS